MWTCNFIIGKFFYLCSKSHAGHLNQVFWYELYHLKNSSNETPRWWQKVLSSHSICSARYKTSFWGFWYQTLLYYWWLIFRSLTCSQKSTTLRRCVQITCKFHIVGHGKNHTKVLTVAVFSLLTFFTHDMYQYRFLFRKYETSLILVKFVIL